MIDEVYYKDILSDKDIKIIHSKIISLDRVAYGLDLDAMVLRTTKTPLFMSEEEAKKILAQDEIKKNEIIEGILKYKKEAANIDNGTVENESVPGQLSGGRHI